MVEIRAAVVVFKLLRLRGKRMSNISDLNSLSFQGYRTGKPRLKYILNI